MAVVIDPVIRPGRHGHGTDWARPSYLLAWLIALALSFGLALAVAATAQVECGPIFLTGGGAPLNGGGALLTAGQKCELKAGPYRMALPSWVNRITPW